MTYRHAKKYITFSMYFLPSIIETFSHTGESKMKLLSLGQKLNTSICPEKNRINCLR